MSISFYIIDRNGHLASPPDFVQTYEDDPIYGRCESNSNPWYINFSNTNTASIFNLLGIEFAHVGKWTANQLPTIKATMSFVLDSLKAMPQLDPFTPAEEITNKPGRTTVVICDRREGYYTTSIEALLSLVDAAIQRDFDIHWS